MQASDSTREPGSTATTRRRGARLGAGLEWLIQHWVLWTGRLVDTRDAPWLVGPVGGDRIGTEIYDSYARELGMEVVANTSGAGLLADFSSLAGPGFDPGTVDPEVHRFYERTADYSLDIWSQWSGVLRPFARVLIALVSRNVEQLNLPLDPLETSRGMTSAVLHFIHAETGRAPYAGWLRRTVSTGSIVYAGFYTVCTPAGYSGPCVKVVFPLPGGSNTVILRPENQSDGSFKLISSGAGFGGPGCYRIHRVGPDRLRVKYVPLQEVIHVYRDDHGVLRTDHTFRFLGSRFLVLHYRIDPRRHG